MDGIDLNIGSYSIDDIFNVFNLTKNCNHENLDLKFRENQELILKLEKEIIIEEKVKVFFKQIYKLAANEINNTIRRKSEQKLNLDQIELKHKRESEQRELEFIKPVYQVNESNYVLNPITPNTIKKQYSISSDYRKRVYEQQFNPRHDMDQPLIEKKNVKETSTSSDFIVEFTEPLSNVISMEIVSSDIAVINYNITSAKRNNKFRISIKKDGVTDPFVTDILIPDGFWMSGSLITYLSDNYFTPSNVTSSVSTILNQSLITFLTFEIDETTAKTNIRFKTINEVIDYNSSGVGSLTYDVIDLITFTVSNIYEDDLHCSTKEINFSKTCLGMFGFVLTDIYDITLNVLASYSRYNYDYDYEFVLKEFNSTNKITYGNQIFKGILKSSEIYGNSIDKGFYITVNDFMGNHGEQIILVGNSNIVNKNIMARCQLKNDPFQINTHNASVDYSIKRDYYGDTKIRKLHIQIINNYGEVVDIQNFPTNFVFEFVIRYSAERQDKFNKNMKI